MKTLSLSLGLAGLLCLVAVADHEECPSSIQYTSGGYLKSGNTYYYRNGNYLMSGSTLYYPSGQYIKSGSSTYYYPNGAYLKSGSSLYYPNGNYVKSGNTFYYSNGSYFKSGSSFYYKNGNYARSGQTLYRPDGSVTPFPVNLSESIGDYGELSALVRKDSEDIHIHFRSLLLQQSDVQLFTQWTEDTFSQLEFWINTGIAGENVILTVTPEGTTCRLAAEPPPAQFTLQAQAASVDVRVKPGFDPLRVRAVLQQALDSILP